MLSDDRPTDPAWLPIFSKKEHFMGNAFGMIPGLEPDEWSNDACRGYVIIHASPKPFKCQRNLMLNRFPVHVKFRANALITVSVYAQLKKLQILVCGNECTVFPDNVSPLRIQTL